MKQRPPDTSAEEPDGGNPHIRFWGGPGLGHRPGLLDNRGGYFDWRPSARELSLEAVKP